MIELEQAIFKEIENYKKHFGKVPKVVRLGRETCRNLCREKKIIPMTDYEMDSFFGLGNFGDEIWITGGDFNFGFILQ